jgi:hypothetical protein
MSFLVHEVEAHPLVAAEALVFSEAVQVADHAHRAAAAIPGGGDGFGGPAESMEGHPGHFLNAAAMLIEHPIKTASAVTTAAVALRRHSMWAIAGAVWANARLRRALNPAASYSASSSAGAIDSTPITPLVD